MEAEEGERTAGRKGKGGGQTGGRGLAELVPMNKDRSFILPV
jgi:hypothetical protein